MFTVKTMKLHRGSKNGHFKLKKIDMWVSSGCNCPKLRKNRIYLIMSMEGQKLVLNDQSFIRETPHRKKDKMNYDKLDAGLQGLAAKGC